MKSRQFPIPKLVRFSKAQWKAICATAKAEQLNVSAYIRQALHRDTVLRK